jgi:DNA-3-methyladenine glycosylase I
MGTDAGGTLGHDRIARPVTVKPGELYRCPWVGDDPLFRQHHDTEWGVPQYDGRALWEHLVLDGFQAGLSWSTVLRRRDGFRSAFAQFDPDHVARFGPADVKRLLGDTRIIRSRAKITAAIANARVYVAMRDRGEGFGTFVWSVVGGAPIQNAWRRQEDVPAETPLAHTMATALKAKGFTFVGPVLVYAWMQATGLVNDHVTRCFRHAEVKQLARPRHPITQEQG